MSEWKAAELRGDKYYEGKPCINCGTTRRLVENRVCYACNKRKSRERAQRKRLERQIAELKQENAALLSGLEQVINEALRDGRGSD